MALKLETFSWMELKNFFLNGLVDKYMRHPLSYNNISLNYLSKKKKINFKMLSDDNVD